MTKENVLQSQHLKTREVKKMEPERRGEKKAKIKWKEGEKIKFKDPDQKAQRTKCVWDVLLQKSQNFELQSSVFSAFKYWESISKVIRGTVYKEID